MYWSSLYRCVSLIRRPFVFGGSRNLCTATVTPKSTMFDDGQWCRVTDMQVSIDEATHQATVKLPGIGMQHINRAGGIDVLAILRWFAGARLYAFFVPNQKTGRTFFEINRLVPDNFKFTVAYKLSMERAMYEFVRRSKPASLSVVTGLEYVGSSSTCSFIKLVDDTSATTLASVLHQVVFANKVTRKPAPLPQWWRERYQKFAMGTRPLIIKPFVVPSNGVHHYTMKVPWSDIDAYKHTTFSAYLQYCFDGAQDAVCAGAVAGFQDDILRYDVRSFEMAFMGETNVNDVLVVTIWQDGNVERRIYCSIAKDDGTIVFQTTLNFY